MRQGRWSIAAMLLFSAVSFATADDRGMVTIGGGAFLPYNGDVGGTAMVGAEGRVGQHLSVGGEVDYRHFDVGRDASVENVNTRALVRYTWFPGVVNPYVGAGAGVGIGWIHGTAHLGAIDLPFRDAGVTVGVLGLAGIDVPLGERVSLFAESRISSDVDVNFGNAQLGGLTGASGARIRF